MLLALALAFSMAGSAPLRWYGPVRVTFDLPVKGNPYDAEANDVVVRFSGGFPSHGTVNEDGTFSPGPTSGPPWREERRAYFDGRHWQTMLSSQHPGSWEVSARLNGRFWTFGDVIIPDKPTTVHYIRIAANRQRFVTDQGTPYWPMGHDLGWHSTGLPPIPETIRQMGAAGMNWSRIWTNPWDGKCPWWTKNIGQLDQKALAQWDSITDAADRAGVRFNLVLFNHGSFSSEVDPNWNDNPWNVKNGGFLSDPVQFFTDPKAIALTKSYLRYMVARYAHHSCILGWELFNEVENTNAARHGHWAEIGAWHRNMEAYLRGIDPYHHLITSSSEQRPELNRGLDYLQAHGYPSDVWGMMLSSSGPGDKPFFFGEIGLGGVQPTDYQQRLIARDGIWGGLLANDAGAGQMWDWEVIQRRRLSDEWTHAREAMNRLGIRPANLRKPIPVTIDAGQGSDLTIVPGRGWAASGKRSFQLPAEAGPRFTGQLSSYLQGKNHQEWANKWIFTFRASKPGVVTVNVGDVAQQGAKLVLDFLPSRGEEVVVFQGGRPGQTLNMPFPAGQQTVTVRNDGQDWANIRSVTFTNIGPNAFVSADIDHGTVIGRIRRNGAGTAPLKFSLAGIPLPNGRHRLRTWDADSNTYASTNLIVRAGKAWSTLTGRDEIFTIR